MFQCVRYLFLKEHSQCHHWLQNCNRASSNLSSSGVDCSRDHNSIPSLASQRLHLVLHTGCLRRYKIRFVRLWRFWGTSICASPTRHLPDFPHWKHGQNGRFEECFDWFPSIDPVGNLRIHQYRAVQVAQGHISVLKLPRSKSGGILSTLEACDGGWDPHGVPSPTKWWTLLWGKQWFWVYDWPWYVGRGCRAQLFFVNTNSRKLVAITVVDG